MLQEGAFPEALSKLNSAPADLAATHKVKFDKIIASLLLASETGVFVRFFLIVRSADLGPYLPACLSEWRKVVLLGVAHAWNARYNTHIRRTTDTLFLFLNDRQRRGLSAAGP